MRFMWCLVPRSEPIHSEILPIVAGEDLAAAPAARR